MGSAVDTPAHRQDPTSEIQSESPLTSETPEPDIPHQYTIRNTKVQILFSQEEQGQNGSTPCIILLPRALRALSLL
jgi:hypothetical protein